MRLSIPHQKEENFKNLFHKLLCEKFDDISFADYSKMLNMSQVAFLLLLLRLFNLSSFGELSQLLNVKPSQLSAWNRNKTKIAQKWSQRLMNFVNKRMKIIRESKATDGAFEFSFNSYKVREPLLERLYGFHPELATNIIHADAANVNGAAIVNTAVCENVDDGRMSATQQGQPAFSLQALAAGRCEVAESSVGALTFEMVDGSCVNLPQSRLQAFRLMEKTLSATSAIVIYEPSQQIAGAGKYVFCIDGRLRVVREVFVGSTGQMFYEESSVLYPLAASMYALVAGKVVAMLYDE